MVKLKEVGELKLIEYILSRISLGPDHLLPKGDDAAAFRFSGNLVVSTDMLVQSTDVPSGMGYRDIGWKAITMVASDLASKGARPIAFLNSIGLPSDMDLDDFKELWSGIEDAVNYYGGKIVGGDTNEAKEIVISCFGIGSADRVVSRGGAKIGNIVATTGYFGRSSSGLYALMNRIDDVSDNLRMAVLRPIARVKEGAVLAPLVTSCIDSSDGLARSLYELSKQSGVGFLITNPPIDWEVERFAEKHKLDLFSLIFYGGEEYELIFTLDEKDLDKAKEAIKSVDGQLIEIGRVTRIEDGISVIWYGERRKIEHRGWEHFRAIG